MGRKPLGHKAVLVELPEIQHLQIKEAARLRTKHRKHRVPVNQVYRDVIQEGLDRLGSALNK